MKRKDDFHSFQQKDMSNIFIVDDYILIIEEW